MSGRRAVLLILANKLTLLNRPTSQLPLVRMRWQEFSVSPVTLTLHPKRHALARSQNVVITSESARRTREGSAFGRNSVLPISGRFAFSGAPPLLRGGWFCFVGRDFAEICVRGGAFKRANMSRAKPLGAKSCRMNTCTKMVGEWGTCCDVVFRRVACSRSEPSNLALCPVLVSPMDSYSCIMLQGNYHGMIFLQKNIGGRGEAQLKL
jgi:hypothetical protein